MSESEMTITFPVFAGIRCLMMPYIQGDPSSVPEEYRRGYEDILAKVFIRPWEVGYLTIDESRAKRGTPHRGARARFGRALHTEAGRLRTGEGVWGGGGWGLAHKVTLDRDVRILLANNIDDSCAVWDCEHEDTTLDGDIGHLASMYPYEDAILMKAGEVRRIGIFTPHESLPVQADTNRQFLRIVSSGVHGREDYFTENHVLGIRE